MHLEVNTTVKLRIAFINCTKNKKKTVMKKFLTSFLKNLIDNSSDSITKPIQWMLEA